MEYSSKLAPKERKIMDLVVHLGEASARDICSRLDDSPSNATVRTQLRILEGKGLLTHRRCGRKFVYSPSFSNDSAAKSAFRRIVDVFFDGSVAQAVSGLLEIDDLQMDREELKKLSEKIEAANRREEEK